MELDWMFISISKSQNFIQSYSLKWHLFQFQGIGTVAWLIQPVGDGRPAAAVRAEPLDFFGGFPHKSSAQYPQFHSQNAGCVRR